jgi:hypothetical protein
MSLVAWFSVAIMLSVIPTAGTNAQSFPFQVMVDEETSGYRFSVQAESISAIQVTVLHLNGKMIFASDWRAGQSLAWSLMESDSELLPNGVYLYRLQARDRDGMEYRRLGKFVLSRAEQASLSVPGVGNLAGPTPSALPPGVRWQQLLAVGGQDNYRVQRRPGNRLPYETMMQLEVGGRLRISELCLGAVLGSGGDCRSDWPTGGGSSGGWLDSGSSVQLATTSDKVGIGTGFPTEKLHVVGNLRLESALICAECVSLADMASSSVDSFKIVDGSIMTADLGPNSVNSAKIADASVNLVDLAPQTCGGGKAIEGWFAGTLFCADLGSTAAGWSLTGNPSTNPSSNFLGTTNNVDLAFRTNNQERMRITKAGDVGIGTTTPFAALDVRRSNAGGNEVVGFFNNPSDTANSQVSLDLGVGNSSPTTWRLRGTASQFFIENAVFPQPAISIDSSNQVSVVGGLGVQGAIFAGTQDSPALMTSAGTVPLILITGPQGMVAFGEANGVWAWGGEAGGHFEGSTGVYASSNAQFGEGVHGHGSGSSTEGVLGTSEHAQGVLGISDGIGFPASGVTGYAKATSGFNVGVYGVTSSPGGVGIRAENTANSATNPTARILDAVRPGDTEFKVQVNGNVYADGTFNPGSADYAELMLVEGQADDYDFGDVLVLSSKGRVELSSKPHDTALAGVYSKKPGVLGDYLKIDDDGTETDAAFEARMKREGPRIAVGLMGILYVKVSAENGPIHAGDLLTTSSTPGHAMKATPILFNGVEFYRTGTILGKALEPLNSKTAVIKVLVTLR